MGKQAYLLFYQLVPDDTNQMRSDQPAKVLSKQLEKPSGTDGGESRQRAREAPAAAIQPQQHGSNSQQSTACSSSDKKSPQNVFDGSNNIDKKLG